MGDSSRFRISLRNIIWIIVATKRFYRKYSLKNLEFLTTRISQLAIIAELHYYVPCPSLGIELLYTIVIQSKGASRSSPVVLKLWSKDPWVPF
ncbi:hypothetical protein TNCV_1626641 [Trichonephila clavipes]|nr:hypothetical protein TNCV_1626641 [Trichonephila clavipes]